MSDKVKEIREIRVKNNDCWMEILSIALEADPERTKVVLARIKMLDAMINARMGELIDE